MAELEHYTAIRCAYPGTGDWILHRDLVIDWLDHSSSVNPILWLTGIPGAGMLSYLMDIPRIDIANTI